MAKIITIDAGHGGTDSGATNGKRHEADDVLTMALAVGKLLTEQGIKVVYTRTTDKDISIDERCKIANNAKSDYFLSIHRNSGGGVGYEIWVHSEASAATCDKAKGILDKVVAVSGKNRGVKKGAPGYSNFGINRLSDAPSALFEMGFIDNSGDNALFDKYFNQYAVAVAKGLCAAVGVNYKEKEAENMAQFKYGDNNNGVFAVKIALLQLKREGIITQGMDANGAFGDGTIIAVKQVQAKAKLPQTGIVDTATLKAINTLLENAEKSDNNTVAALKSKIAKAQAALK